MNYTVQEYARDVIFAIGEACLEAEVDDPIVINRIRTFHRDPPLCFGY